MGRWRCRPGPSPRKGVLGLETDKGRRTCAAHTRARRAAISTWRTGSSSACCSPCMPALPGYSPAPRHDATSGPGHAACLRKEGAVATELRSLLAALAVQLSARAAAASDWCGATAKKTHSKNSGSPREELELEGAGRSTWSTWSTWSTLYRDSRGVTDRPRQSRRHSVPCTAAHPRVWGRSKGRASV